MGFVRIYIRLKVCSWWGRSRLKVLTQWMKICQRIVLVPFLLYRYIAFFTAEREGFVAIELSVSQSEYVPVSCSTILSKNDLEFLYVLIISDEFTQFQPHFSFLAYGFEYNFPTLRSSIGGGSCCCIAWLADSNSLLL